MSIVHLMDGRRLAYSEVGPAEGFPVLYLHGAIGSPMRWTDELLAVIDELSVRIIAPQRPGFGLSDPHPRRTLLGYPDDVEQLANALGLARFALMGVSAGGPYAVACGHRLAHRVTAAAVVSSLSPLTPPSETPGLPRRIRLPLRAICAWPRATTRLGDATVALVARHPKLLLRAMTIGAPPADRSHVADGATSLAAVDAFLAATGGGIGGLVDDHLVTSRPWGFELSAVAAEVHLWHGMGDAFVPVEHALQLAAALPRCKVSLDPGEGHFFFRRHVKPILTALAATRSARSATVRS